MAQLPFFKVGDFGQTIRRVIVDEKNDPVDISASTTAGDLAFIFQDPQGNVDTKLEAQGVSFTTDGTDGQVEYVVESTLFDEEGVWKLQVRISETGSNSYRIYTDQEDLTILPVLA